MGKRKRAAAILLVLVMVMSLGSILTVPAHGLVLDPVSWLYPIWMMYGQQAGVTISTMGGDEFTQQGFSGLFNEWQQWEVSSGYQQAATTISDWVNSFLDAVSVVAGAISGGTLFSKIQLGSRITAQLARFWNWIIDEKLEGSSVDSVDFNQSNGNLVLSAAEWQHVVAGWYLYEGRTDYQVSAVTDDDVFAYGYQYTSNGYQYGRVVMVCDVHFGVTLLAGGNTLNLNSNLSSDGYYYVSYHTLQARYGQPQPNCVIYSNYDTGYAAITEWLGAGSPGGGSITVAPDAGVDVLGFPDTDDLDYIPADAVIPWNIPYDETKDTNGYLDEAYEKALDNELTDTDAVSHPPVEGTGTVEDVGSYVVPGLAEVFPFCLPFDVYNFLSALAAEPEAPHFSCELEFPEAIGGTQEIEIDFDAPTWNQLAQLLRLLELFAFCVGLAFVTRSMFIRG